MQKNAENSKKFKSACFVIQACSNPSLCKNVIRCKFLPSRHQDFGCERLDTLEPMLDLTRWGLSEIVDFIYELINKYEYLLKNIVFKHK
jgi:hypothetical protein